MITSQLLDPRLFIFVFVIKRYQNDPGVSTISSENLIPREETRCKGGARQLNVENFVDFLFVLSFDNWII